ncbi:MAG TPA: membrane protein insertase YidC [Pyrinomonadaceae bacterium]|nr:membrane protein insertase YidC [Pyrinomonadaceae bacterium]
MEQNNQGQSRFLIAAVASMVVLFAWSYFYSPSKPAANNSNTEVAANTNTNTNTATPQAAPSQAVPQPQAVPAQPAEVVPDANPNRTVTIKSPLYEVKIDSKGALATSWILLRNKSPKNDYPIYADGSTVGEDKPLELISTKAAEEREFPFRLETEDQVLNADLNGRNYQVSSAEDTITLAPGEEKTVELTLTLDKGVTVKKSFVFRADSYVADLGVDLRQNGQPLPNAKLAIGASIGDHAINFHNTYHTESEAVVSVNGDIKRHLGNYSFTYDASGRSTLSDSGTIDWVGMSDAYFAMAAIPAAPIQSAEYRASKYDVDISPVYDTIWKWVIRSPKTTETRHLVTAFMPVATDGAFTKLFTGPKDYFLLDSLSPSIKPADGRDVSIVNLINFSNYWWLRWLTKPLSIPIIYALNFFNGILHNYGVAIIVFTFLFYSLLFPLRWKQSKSFKKAAGNAPKMKELQDKLKDFQKKGIPADDPRMRALQMEQLKLTKDALPIGGCLPMLLQFPLLIAFYTAITIALDARQATFMWLPDLSAADPFHILEFAFAGSMILAMKFTPTAPAVSPEQQMQQKMMTYLMPAMMLWVMWTAPAGLLIYWLFGNVVSFGQQMLINRMNKPGEPPTAVVENVPENAKKVGKGKQKLNAS